ncbi:GGDEF domain-containing protein [Thermoleptolyngbya sp. M55_K2018_002]|uniref:GGDEF domain-containing protein n=1 Tax=Thermoleptolyngbya sp. M55_K2018_002 TaxID=2747808 RepID=UPI0019F2A588|nr:GGDEF domain-containing protein [Thermoleptolyngbya sp. M55_K2018_002]HIK39030.1 GGDEF domain-containing protein [Thermoleptolyngbya sp. M55_K2018_002]
MRIEQGNWIEQLAHQPIWVQVAVYTLIVLTIGWLDHLLGSDIVLSLFYLIPIAWAAWCSPRPVALYITLLSLLVIFLLAEYSSGLVYTETIVSLWRSITRLGFFLVTSTLITRLRKTQDQLRWLSSMDELTQAVNARVFTEKLAQEIERSRRYGRLFAIAYLDLDSFKQVNDQRGHLEGDRILKLVSQVVRDSIRKTDLLARLGGDEFALLLPETNLRAAKTIISRIQTQLVDTMQAEQSPITLSIGVVVCTQPPSSQAPLIHYADQLMYQVKRTGKNAAQFAMYPDASAPRHNNE